MPATAPFIAKKVADKLIEMGKQIRAQRKAMRINATTAAEAAGMSRVTLYRIENGEPSVTMGAYLNAMAALNIEFGTLQPADRAQVTDREGWIPARIHLEEYPQLRQLSWQVHGTEELTPAEALNIYERNWRHVEDKSLEPRERQLIEALRVGLGKTDGIV